MKSSLVYLISGLGLLFYSCKSGSDDPSSGLPKVYTIDQFYKTTSVGAVEFNTDESAILVHSNKTGIYNGYELPVNGDSIRPLTTSTTESIFMIGYKPGTSDYFYSSDKGGNENDHIYLQEAGKEVQDMTPGDKVKAGFLQWARDKKSMFFTSNQRDERFFDIYELDLASLKSIPPYWESFRKALYDEMGDPYTMDSVRLYNISPLFHASKVTKPLMVLQGANDPRVLQVESDEIVAGVKKNGVPVEYVLFPDEGHGFLKKENEIKGYGQVGTFLETYLKKETVKN